MLSRDVYAIDPVTLTTWPDGTPKKRARSERVYRPANKREWRSVYWILEPVPPNQLTKPTDIIIELDNGVKLRYRKQARKQYSFSSTKYGDECAHRKAEAILQFIDLTGLLPPLSSITATCSSRSEAPAKSGHFRELRTRKNAPKRYKSLTYGNELISPDAQATASNRDFAYSWPLTLGDVATTDAWPQSAVRVGEFTREQSSSSESMNIDYVRSIWRGGSTPDDKTSLLTASFETVAPDPASGLYSQAPPQMMPPLPALYAQAYHCCYPPVSDQSAPLIV